MNEDARELRNGCLGFILVAAALMLLMWLTGAGKNAAGPLGDDRPCVPLIEYCYAMARGKQPERPNYATANECEELVQSDACRR